MDYNCPSCGIDLKSVKVKLKFLKPSPNQKYPTCSGWYKRCPHCETVIVENISQAEVYLTSALILFFSMFTLCGRIYLRKHEYNDSLSLFLIYVTATIFVYPIYLFIKKGIPQKESYWKIYIGNS